MHAEAKVTKCYLILKWRYVSDCIFIYIFIYVIQHCFICLPPLRFYCVGGCWDRTQDCCDFGIDSQML